MNKNKKKFLWIALLLVAAGIIISFIALAAMGFRWSQPESDSWSSHTYVVEQSFSHMDINASGNVRLLPAQGNQTTVVYETIEGVDYDITVTNDTLEIHRNDKRKWYQRWILWAEDSDLDIYLPQQTYQSLRLSAYSGNMEIPAFFSFDQADIYNSGGNINFTANVHGELSLETVSGNIYTSGNHSRSLHVEAVSGDILVESVTLEEDLYAQTVSGNLHFIDVKGQHITTTSTSGDILVESATINGDLHAQTVSASLTLNDVLCQDIVATSTSGDMEINHLIAQGHIQADNISGDIQLQACDAASLTLETVSGDIGGSLLSDKWFTVYTTSGDVQVPASAGNSLCANTTVSGNIHWQIQPTTAIP